MKRFCLLLLFLHFSHSFALAQFITRDYDDVSLSEALLQLSREQENYTISFIYNELEDFRITTSIKHKSVPDAIRQMIGFYPLRMTFKPEDSEIFVESIQKTDNHYTGVVVDEKREPISYANVVILSTRDSILLGGGVTNESGYFAIPSEQDTVLARISYVGYKTVYKLCEQPEIGTICLLPEKYTLDGVLIEGERPKVQLKGSSLVMNVEGTVMERIGTAEDLLSRVPMIAKRGDAFEILGKGIPLIYINNRKLTDLSELKNIPSDNIKSIEVIQNPGARYDATAKAVIIIHTKRSPGEGFGVEMASWSRKSHGYANNERINITYRKNKLELFANIFGAYNKNWSRSEFEQTVFADTLWVITNKEKSIASNPFFEGRFGFNYQKNDNNSFGGFYQKINDYVKTHTQSDDDLKANEIYFDHLQNSSIRDSEAPKHQVNIYYSGLTGNLKYDFNADYIYQTQRSRNRQEELSDTHENRDVNTNSLTQSNLVAEKFIASYPLWKGQIEVGEEYTNTRWESNFENKEGYIANSSNEQHESNIAPFIEIRQQLGLCHLSAGLRYEHVKSVYYVGRVLQEEQCRNYNDFFPSVSCSSEIKDFRFSASYSKRTTRPSYWQLSSDVLYENRLNLQTGNPFLKPIKYNNMNATVMWKWLYLATNYTHCADPILYTAESLKEDSKVNFVTYKNYDHADWLNLTLGAQKDIKLGQATWTPQYNVTLMKPWFKSVFLGKEKSFNHPMLVLQLGNIVVLPHDWLLQADFNMHTHGYQQNVWFDCTNKIITFSVSKDFFKHRFNVKLSGNDLLYGGINRFTLYSNRMMFRKIEDNDSRNVTLSMRYRFNVTPSKYKGTGAGNEEKNRL